MFQWIVNHPFSSASLIVGTILGFQMFLGEKPPQFIPATLGMIGWGIVVVVLYLWDQERQQRGRFH